MSNKVNEEVKKEPSKLDKLKEMWKDKRGRAKIKLTLYFIFFFGVIIFARVLNSQTSKLQNENIDTTSFIYTIEDNYEYDINVEIDNNVYHYHGKKLGLNESLSLKANDKEEYYYVMNNKYYELDDNGNYILASSEDIYSYLNYKYMSINYIKTLITLSTSENNIYKIKLSDLILNNNSDNYIIITIDNDNKIVTIDYTELFKIDKEDITKVLVTMTYSNINNILSLEE